jgi:hypothetical protein
MPSIVKLINGDALFALQQAGELVEAANIHKVITLLPGTTEHRPIHVVVSNIATIEERSPADPVPLVSYGD